MNYSSFETFKLVDELLDPEFSIHKLCSELNLYLGRDLADSSILDFKVDEYALLMKEAVADLQRQGILRLLKDNRVVTEHWITEMMEFHKAAIQWRTR